jgi:hypothetical protein
MTNDTIEDAGDLDLASLPDDGLTLGRTTPLPAPQEEPHIELTGTDMIVTLPSSQTESTSSGGFVPLLIGGERGRDRLWGRDIIPLVMEWDECSTRASGSNSGALKRRSQTFQPLIKRGRADFELSDLTAAQLDELSDRLSTQITDFDDRLAVFEKAPMLTVLSDTALAAYRRGPASSGTDRPAGRRNVCGSAG